VAPANSNPFGQAWAQKAPFGETYAESGTSDRVFTGQNQDTNVAQRGERKSTPNINSPPSRLPRRAYLRIERAIAPSRKELLRQLLDERIEKVFGCTPGEFRSYILSHRDSRKK
jgi:hypothetical protein